MNPTELFWSDILKVKQLADAKAVAVEEWGEDIPETLLFAYIGRAITNSVESLKDNERILVSKAIELGLESEDQKLAGRIATGLLEALYNHTMTSKRPWAQLEQFLGEHAKAYIEGWTK